MSACVCAVHCALSAALSDAALCAHDALLPPALLLLLLRLLLPTRHNDAGNSQHQPPLVFLTSSSSSTTILTPQIQISLKLLEKLAGVKREEEPRRRQGGR